MHIINGDNLVFLISQPRSGSTLLQQLLINTGELASVPEPWLMLPLVYVYKKTDITPEYNPKYAYINFNAYLNSHPGAHELLKKCLRQTALELYNLNKLDNKQKYFLDKTPRYYHIVNELFGLFPGARFIFLSRNPVSVFASILEHNLTGNITRLFAKDRQDDLIKAPRTIAEIKKSPPPGRKVHFIKYEDMVMDSETCLKQLYDFMEIDAHGGNHGTYTVADNFVKYHAADIKSLCAHNTIMPDYLASWKKSIDDGQKKSLLLEYVRKLGADIFNDLGYDYNEMLDSVSQHRVRYKIPLPWKTLEKSPADMSLRELIGARFVSGVNRMLDRAET